MLLDKIKKLCNENKITITELEKALKFGNATIHKWDTAQPSAFKVKMVAEYFNVSIDYLLNEDMHMPTKESMDIATEYESLSDNQKVLVKSYILLFKNTQLTQNGA